MVTDQSLATRNCNLGNLCAQLSEGKRQRGGSAAGALRQDAAGGLEKHSHSPAPTAHRSLHGARSTTAFGQSTPRHGYEHKVHPGPQQAASNVCSLFIQQLQGQGASQRCPLHPLGAAERNQGSPGGTGRALKVVGVKQCLFTRRPAVTKRRIVSQVTTNQHQDGGGQVLTASRPQPTPKEPQTKSRHSRQSSRAQARCAPSKSSPSTQPAGGAAGLLLCSSSMKSAFASPQLLLACSLPKAQQLTTQRW